LGGVGEEEFVEVKEMEVEDEVRVEVEDLSVRREGEETRVSVRVLISSRKERAEGLRGTERKVG